MACNCIKKVNVALLKAEANTELDIPLCFNLISGKATASTCVVATSKINPHKRGKAKTVFAKYCPCCGKAYEEAKTKTKRRVR
jgi:hypothetical protein